MAGYLQPATFQKAVQRPTSGTVNVNGTPQNAQADGLRNPNLLDKFHALWLTSSSLIRNSRQSINPLADGIAPFDGLSSLKLEARKGVAVPFGIDAALESFPLGDKITGAIGSVVVRVIHVLNDRFSGMQNVRIWHMMKEEQQVIGTRRERSIRLDLAN